MPVNGKDEVDAAAVLEQDAVVDGMVEDKAARRNGEARDDALDGTAAGDLDGQHGGVNSKTSSQNIHDAVISKYRERGVFFTSCSLVFVAGAVLLIDRSRFSNFWIVLVLAIAAFFVFVQSKNISHSYIAEAQRLMHQEVRIPKGIYWTPPS